MTSSPSPPSGFFIEFASKALFVLRCRASTKYLLLSRVPLGDKASETF